MFLIFSEKLATRDMLWWPLQTSMTCIFGRDGVDDSDWNYAVDNSDCSEWEQEILSNTVRVSRDTAASYRLTTMNWMLMVCALMAVFAVKQCHWRESKVLSTDEKVPLLPSSI